MKGNIAGRLSFFVVMLVIGVTRTASAQTYSGYLKLDDDSIKGPDSLLVTITVPKDAYVRDTVLLSRGEYRDLKKTGQIPYHKTPWMMGVKTNLLSDVIVLPYAGVEVQLARNLSLDLNGWYTKWNIFYPNKQTKIYGLAPELRWWFGGRAMTKGYFVGLHANAGWYTLEWRDEQGRKVVYQNGSKDLDDPGIMPAWSCGLTYGYSQPLDKKGHWNMEFFMGLGYSSYQQKCFVTNAEGKIDYHHEKNTDFGITKVGINLTYRFSLRRVKSAYYDYK